MFKHIYDVNISNVHTYIIYDVNILSILGEEYKVSLLANWWSLATQYKADNISVILNTISSFSY